jgi:hypothetical protein
MSVCLSRFSQQLNPHGQRSLLEHIVTEQWDIALLGHNVTTVGTEVICENIATMTLDTIVAAAVSTKSDPSSQFL